MTRHRVDDARGATGDHRRPSEAADGGPAAVGTLPPTRRGPFGRRHPPVPEDLLSARLVVLASGEGSTLQALLAAAADPGFGAQVVAVGSDRPAAKALGRAAQAGIDTFVVPVADHPDRAAWDVALAAAISAHAPDLVVCAGFMRIVGPAVLAQHTLVNTHPSLLPSFAGAHAVADALAHGVKVTGVTVHLVDAGLDTGPIVAQAAVPVLPGDDEQTLHHRIKDAERPLVVAAVGRLARGGWTVEGRTVVL